jgi:hypothetical protein
LEEGGEERVKELDSGMELKQGNRDARPGVFVREQILFT